jgi:hypothetical protein
MCALQAAVAILWDEVMLLSGAAALMTIGWLQGMLVRSDC